MGIDDEVKTAPSGLIDRAADALAKLPIRDGAAPGGELDRLRLREAVRAVLNTIREPTEAMLEAAHHLDGYTVYDTNASAEAHWEAMIDAALSERA